MGIFRKGSIAHVRKGLAYHLANSLRGIRAARRARKREIDLDLQMTKDGVIVVCHWPRPLLHDGFRDPQGKIGRLRTVSSMTLAEVRRLRAHGGYRIVPLAAALQECGKVGIDARLEPKGDRRFRNQARWDLVRNTADHFGVKLRGYALPQNAAALPYMRSAGIPSTRLKGH